jgi:superoxide dismutase, Cu-Zn family
MRFSAILGLLLAGLLLVGLGPLAASAVATISATSTSGAGASLGTVTFTDTAAGLLITPKLSGMPPGEHGFHIHEIGKCGPGISEGKPAVGFAAGGHYDPGHTKKNTWDHSVPPVTAAIFRC